MSEAQPLPPAPSSPPPRRPRRGLVLVALLFGGLVAAGAVAHRQGWDDIARARLGFLPRHPWLVERPARVPLTLARTFPKPARKWKVVLDAGHGGKDPGALARFGDKDEKDINLEVTLAVAEHLRARTDMEVTLTRSTDATLGRTARADISARNTADAFLSFHATTSSLPLTSGFMNIWSRAQEAPHAARRSPWLAHWVGAALVDAGFSPKAPGLDIDDPTPPIGERDYRSSWDAYGGFVTTNYNPTVIADNVRPAVLIETHFLTSPLEVRAFNQPATLARFAAAVELGLLNFLHAQEGPAAVPITLPVAGGWTVQVMATTSKGDADRAAKALTAAKFSDVRVLPHADPEASTTHYRVRVGNFPARTPIADLERRLRTAGFDDGWVVYEEAAGATRP